MGINELFELCTLCNVNICVFRFGVRSMHIMKECFVPFSIGLALQKDSIYTEQFSKKIQQLIEGGFIEKWLEDEMNKVAKKAKLGASKEAKPLIVQHLQVEAKESNFWYPNSFVIVFNKRQL